MSLPGARTVTDRGPIGNVIKGVPVECGNTDWVSFLSTFHSKTESGTFLRLSILSLQEFVSFRRIFQMSLRNISDEPIQPPLFLIFICSVQICEFLSSDVKS